MELLKAKATEPSVGYDYGGYIAARHKLAFGKKQLPKKGDREELETAYAIVMHKLGK